MTFPKGSALQRGWKCYGEDWCGVEMCVGPPSASMMMTLSAKKGGRQIRNVFLFIASYVDTFFAR